MAFDYNFDLYKEGIVSLTEGILESNIHFHYIVGIVRGGAIPAIHLSHKLGIPCKLLQWQTREAVYRDNVSAVVLSGYLSMGKNILLVDDIADSGKTFSEILAFLDKHRGGADDEGGLIRTAALVTRLDSEVQPDFSHIKNYDEGWVDFWWETC